MIKLENTEIVGWEAAIRGMRNPMNSWEKSDSDCLYHMVENWKVGEDLELDKKYNDLLDKWNLNLKIGSNDLDLMKRLAAAGPVHAKYRRMIAVYADITAPLYWWKEFDTYKVGTVANSCSTMHKIHEKEFTLEDFSCEHLIDSELAEYDYDDGFLLLSEMHPEHTDIPYEYNTVIFPKDLLMSTIKMLNQCRELYLQTKDKKYWWQMIQLLPSSYNQKRTVMLNYEVLAGIYPMRKNHKLDEWHDFCHWIEGLPYSEVITG